MATATHLLTVEEFRARYANEKPYYEYWFGEAVQKSAPTWLHGVLQALLCELLRGSGYKSGTEVELRVADDWQPKPDVIGTTHVDEPYPTKPPDVVVEVLSPDDRMHDVFRKCRSTCESASPLFSFLIPNPKMRGRGVSIPTTWSAPVLWIFQTGARSRLTSFGNRWIVASRE